ncbi:TlpA family protein disulfide reductase [Pseudomonas aeruginosa]|uniref:TlpA family protein disulfide reductase n=1 Tax=Pseudomonas aeruginosa TaxID=287 RepID=UPI003FD0AE36
MLAKSLSLLALTVLLAACQDQADETKTVTAKDSQAASSTTAQATQTVSVASTDMEEDPRLKRLIGQPGPAVTLQSLTGGPINLSDLYGKKPVYLKMWASYCIPCRAQMPKFGKIYEEMGNRMEIIAVNAGIGDDAQKISKFAAQTKLHVPIAIDDGNLSAWMQMQGTPVHLVIGRNGRVIFSGQGDGPELDAALQQALDSQPASGAIQTSPTRQLASLKQGDQVPEINVTLPNGSPSTLAAGSTGKPRALLFTATWCEDYLKEMEPQTSANCTRLRQDFNTLSKKGDVQWSGVVTHLWTTPQGLSEYQQKTQQQQPYVLDSEGKAFQLFGIRRFPAVALIDAQGRLQRIVGPEDKDLTQAVAKLAQQ